VPVQQVQAPSWPQVPSLVSFGSFWDWLPQLGAWVTNGSLHAWHQFTEWGLIEPVYAAQNNFGNSASLNYINPSYTVLGDGSYNYVTTFGVYNILYRTDLKAYVVSYHSLAMATGTQMSHTVFALTHGSNLLFAAAQWVLGSTTVTTEHYQSSLILMDATGKTTIGTYVFTVQFQRTAPAEIVVQFNKLEHETGNSNPCKPTSPSCSSYWDDLGYGVGRWIWGIVPVAGYDSYQSLSKGNVNVASLGSNATIGANAVDGSAAQAKFGQWSASWVSEGSQSVSFSKANPLTSEPSLLVSFPVNQFYVDPTFGVTSTGTSAYPRAKTVTANGSAQISTAQSVFGGASGLFASATSDYLSLADSADWAFGAGSFTIGFRVWFNSLPASGADMTIFSQRVDSNNVQFLVLENNSGTLQWKYQCTSGGSSVIGWLKTPPAQPVVNTWYAFELDRRVDTGAMDGYQGGTQFGDGTRAGTVPDFAVGVLIGAYTSGANFLDGYLDDLYVLKGTALHTANYTIPTVPFARTSTTVLLLHNDGANASTTFLDDATTGQTIGTQVQYSGTTCTSCVSSFSFYVTNYSSGDLVVLAFYSDVLGSPSLELWNSATAGTDCGATGWCTITEASGTDDNAWANALVNGSYYWFMWQVSTNGSSSVAYSAMPSYAAGSANTGIYLFQAFGTLLSTWSGGTLSTENYSEYATYATGFATTVALNVSFTVSPSLTRSNVVQVRTETNTFTVSPSETRSNIVEVRTESVTFTVSPSGTRSNMVEVRTETNTFTVSPSGTRSNVVEVRTETNTFTVSPSDARSVVEVRTESNPFTVPPSLSRGVDSLQRVVSGFGVTVGAALSRGIVNTERTISSAWGNAVSSIRSTVDTRSLSALGVTVSTSLSRGRDNIQRVISSFGISVSASLSRGVISTQRVLSQGWTNAVTYLSRTVGHTSAISILEQLSTSFNTNPSVVRVVGSVRSIGESVASTVSFIVNFFINGVSGTIWGCPPICPISVIASGGDFPLVVVIVLMVLCVGLAGAYLFMSRRRVSQ
jgi:hypothetical protein